jgi:hypothetical protein
MEGGPDIRIDGLSFDGFEAGFADRAAMVFERALAEGATGLALDGDQRFPSLDLTGVDFSTPDALGRSLATALLRALGR